MSQSDDLELHVEVRVWDTEENSIGQRKDEYNVDLFNDSTVMVTRFHEEHPAPLEIFIDTDNLRIDDLPPRIASVVQDYLDDSVINWPTVYNSRQGEIDREETIIEIEDEQGNEYRFRVWGKKYVEPTKNSGGIERHQIPQPVLDEANRFIPSGVDWFPPP